MRRHDIHRHAEQLLASLGASSSEVATALEAQGVRGVPNDPYQCVLARYLSAIIPAEAGIEEVGVGVLSPWSLRSELRVRLGSRPRRPLRVPLPAAVNRFLADFDGGRYPALADPGSEGSSSAQTAFAPAKGSVPHRVQSAATNNNPRPDSSS